jgi:two-component system, OmpR family, response regulator
MDETLERVLYVEDEPDIQAVARLALEQLGGFDVAVCSSGKEAVERIQQFSPDIVLLDVMMPGMDGPTTLRALRAAAEGRDVPVVFMTAKAQPQEIAHYKRLGAIDVIPKPFDPMTLADQVRSIWDRRHG